MLGDFMKKLVVISAVWCPSCLVMSKYLKQIKENYDLKIEKFDYDFDEEEIKKYNVDKKLPVLILIDNDKEIKRTTGEKDYKEIEEFIKED